MFQIIDATTSKIIDKSIAYYEADFVINYNNGTYNTIPLILEKCKIGDNIDIKYKDLGNKIRFGRTIDDFECISSKDGDKSLFYEPNIGFSSINLYFIMKDNNSYIPEKLQSLIINENNLINHKDKNSPMSKSYIYQLTDGYSSSEYHPR